MAKAKAKKHFQVTLARYLRESLTIIVEADSQEFIESNLHELYQEVDMGDYDEDWDVDCEFGCDDESAEVDEELKRVKKGAKVLKLKGARVVQL